jgi:hypothetical protein
LFTDSTVLVFWQYCSCLLTVLFLFSDSTVLVYWQYCSCLLTVLFLLTVRKQEQYCQ